MARSSDPRGPVRPDGGFGPGNGDEGDRAARCGDGRAARAERLAKPIARAWPVLRWAIGLGLAALALWALAGREDELQQIGTQLGHLRWWWILPAVAAETCSFLSFAAMQRTLLRAGNLDVRFGSLVGVTFAAQAVNNSLPGGNVLSALYGFRWFRRFGADDALAAWALVGTIVGASLSLALVAAAGVGLATELGASLDLITVIIGVLAVMLVAGALLLYERPLVLAVTGLLHATKRLVGRPRGDLGRAIARVVSWITVVRLGWRDALGVVARGAGNWLFDCGCFALCFPAVGAPVPWKGLLLAYGAGQLAANLPITPGGLGAVEGSITIALVAFGGSAPSTVAAVLLYRLISFWGELPVGWTVAAALARSVRRGRWPELGPLQLFGTRQPATAARTPAMGLVELTGSSPEATSGPRFGDDGAVAPGTSGRSARGRRSQPRPACPWEAAVVREQEGDVR